MSDHSLWREFTKMEERAVAAEARLADAEWLLRATQHPTQFAVIPPGWVHQRDEFLRTANSASDAPCVINGCTNVAKGRGLFCGEHE